MMESDGWSDLIQDLQQIEHGVTDINTMDNDKDLWHAKGQLHIINFIMSLENVTRLTLEQPESSGSSN